MSNIDRQDGTKSVREPLFIQLFFNFNFRLAGLQGFANTLRKVRKVGGVAGSQSSATEIDQMSTHLFNSKHENTDFKIKWNIIDKAPEINPTTRKRQLCDKEKSIYIKRYVSEFVCPLLFVPRGTNNSQHWGKKGKKIGKKLKKNQYINGVFETEKV